MYLPDIDEISLKVYLYAYKYIFGSYSRELTMDMICRELKFSTVQVMNAFKYWKNQGVIDYSIDEFGEIENIEFYNFYALYTGTLSVEEAVKNEKDIEKPLVDNKMYISKIEEIIGMSLMPHEISTIIETIEETRQSFAVVYRAYLYADSKKLSKGAKYICGILRGWKRDNNIVTETDLDNFFSKKESKRRVRIPKNTKKYIEEKDILTDEEKIKKLEEDQKTALELLEGY